MGWFWNGFPYKRVVSDPGRLQNYIVNTEMDGRLSRTGLFQSSEAQLKRMVRHIVRFFRERQGPCRLLFYCHGGLVSEAEAGAAIEAHYQTFLQNGVYPVFFIWQSSLLEILEDHLREMAEHRVYQMTAVDGVVDELVEEVAKLFPEPWEEIKHRAEQVFASHGGGWRFLLLLAKALQRKKLQVAVHLVGHSAGALVLQTLLKQLLEEKAQVHPHLQLAACSLYAPACTVDQFETTFAKAVDRLLLKRFFLYTLSDELERTDPSVPLYSKSILYLISRGLEAQSGDKPIFGMQMYARRSPSLQRILAHGQGAWVVASRDSRPVYFATRSDLLELVSHAKRHGDFSADPATLDSTLRTVIGSNRLLAEFK